MASTPSNSPPPATAETHRGLEVSPYDRVASMLVTLLALVGFVVGIMFLLFITMRIVASRHAVPLEFMEELDPTATMDTGGPEDFEEPGLEEMQELPEPQLSEMMQAVTDAVTAEPRKLDMLDGNRDLTGKGGDGRGTGPPGPDEIPFGRRTRIDYEETSLSAYGQILDYFGIELGAAGGGIPTVDYASNFSQPTPNKRSGSPRDEDRVYLIWRRGSQLEQADRKLLARAGVPVKDRQVMQFLPKPVEQTLKNLEAKKAAGRHPSMLRLTVYRVVPQGQGYTFEVKDQQYRTPP